MIKSSVSGVLAILLLSASAAHAEISVQQLIEQTAIVASNAPLRDDPDWSVVQKIVVREGALDLAAAQQAYRDVQFVEVESTAETLAEIGDADAYIGNCDAQVLAAGERLRWVQRMGAGVERCVGISSIANGDVILTNMQKMDSPVIAEHAIAMMMALSRQLPRFVRAMDDGSWQRGPEVRGTMTSVVGKKLLVVGLGGIGTEVARFGSALGMQVSATRNSRREGPDFVGYVGLTHELLELAAQSDVIISALPLTDATTNLFDKEFFSQLKGQAIFINVGRGKSVVTDDLLAALRSGQLAGAGLDVTQPEPLPADHPLWALPNVIITPHLSSGGGERERRAVLLKENLRRFVAGGKLLNVVDPKRGY
ncbi:MAG: D-2-hydroxyacid dehydrogenase [Lysobacterales bacterium]